MEMLTFAAIVCVTHAVIGLSAHFHASAKNAGHPKRKSKQPDLWWLRLIQLGFGLLCLFFVSHFSTAQEKTWLCGWLVLMSLTPILSAGLAYFGIHSIRLVHGLVIALTLAGMIYVVRTQTEAHSSPSTKALSPP